MLSNLSAAKKGIISFDSNLTLSNTDLNLTKKHYFDKPLSEAYLSLGSLAGDSITTEIYFTFSKNTVVKSIGNELKNLDAEPVEHKLSAQGAIIELKKELSLNASASHDNNSTKEGIDSSLRRAFDLNALALNIVPAEPVMSFRIDLNESDLNASSLQADLNEFLSGFNSVTEKQFTALDDSNELFGYLLFDSVGSISTAEAGIKSFLEGKGIPEM
ncbi:hypothetical protein HZB89_00405 [archaeon]|nr:hypothetical protein [archaeon]